MVDAGRVRRKPGSVRHSVARGAATVIHLGPSLPKGSSDRPGDRGEPPNEVSCLILLQAGFAMPELLPTPRWALTPPFHPHHLSCEKWQFAFCGTVLEVTSTGNYPAPCSAEPGLSSRTPEGVPATVRLTRLWTSTTSVQRPATSSCPSRGAAWRAAWRGPGTPLSFCPLRGESITPTAWCVVGPC